MQFLCLSLSSIQTTISYCMWCCCCEVKWKQTGEACNGDSENKYFWILCITRLHITNKCLPKWGELCRKRFLSTSSYTIFGWKLIVHLPHAMFTFHSMLKTAKRCNNRIELNIRLHSYCIFLKRLNCFPSLCRNVFFLWLLSRAAAQVRASCFAGQRAN